MFLLEVLFSFKSFTKRIQLIDKDFYSDISVRFTVTFLTLLQSSMDSVKEELHLGSKDCPTVLPFEEISFVVKHELLPDPETVPLTDNTYMVRYVHMFLIWFPALQCISYKVFY